MTPIVVSYRQDIHGGAGERGVQAKCTQCHIPHDNAVNYMFMKARFGMHDAWAQLTYDLDAIDWQAKREHSESYVFDSGCLECHSDLERASESSAVSFVADRPYFLGTTGSRCVTCHDRVGHKNLSAHLPANNHGESSG
jgi:cytochrome c-type protein NapC